AVHCAHEDPFPLVILESLAKGKLVIGANSGGVPEMITDGVNGFLQDSTDVPGLARRIATSVSAFEDYASLRRAAHDTIRKRFSSPRMIEQFEQLYDELVGTPVAEMPSRQLSGAYGDLP